MSEAKCLSQIANYVGSKYPAAFLMSANNAGGFKEANNFINLSESSIEALVKFTDLTRSYNEAGLDAPYRILFKNVGNKEPDQLNFGLLSFGFVFKNPIDPHSDSRELSYRYEPDMDDRDDKDDSNNVIHFSDVDCFTESGKLKVRARNITLVYFDEDISMVPFFKCMIQGKDANLESEFMIEFESDKNGWFISNVDQLQICIGLRDQSFCRSLQEVLETDTFLSIENLITSKLDQIATDEVKQLRESQEDIPYLGSFHVKNFQESVSKVASILDGKIDGGDFLPAKKRNDGGVDFDYDVICCSNKYDVLATPEDEIEDESDEERIAGRLYALYQKHIKSNERRIRPVYVPDLYANCQATCKTSKLKVVFTTNNVIREYPKTDVVDKWSIFYKLEG